MGFKYKDFGTFTGPLDKTGDYFYEKVSKEGFWHEDLPQDLSFKLSDIGIVFYRDRSDYAYFHLYGTSTSLVTLEKNSGDLPNLLANIQNTVFNGKIIVNDKIVCNSTIIANDNVVCNSIVNLSGIGNVEAYLKNLNATKLDKSNKGFDIPHPNKEGYRLRHICVEGPEDGPIYFRGKLEGKNIIEIPDYWNGLVDFETLTVNLTPIGSYQELFVESVQWNKNIVIKNREGGPINCYYQVWAARKYDDKLQVEYLGETPKDYPGDNSRFSIAGYDYDRG